MRSWKVRRGGRGRARVLGLEQGPHRGEVGDSRPVVSNENRCRDGGSSALSADAISVTSL